MTDSGFQTRAHARWNALSAVSAFILITILPRAWGRTAVSVPESLVSRHVREVYDPANLIVDVEGSRESTAGRRGLLGEYVELKVGSESRMKASIRTLQQSLKDSTITEVSTPKELQNAVLSGDRHILLTNHIDLTTVQPLDSIGIQSSLATLQYGKVQTIRGNCSSSPTSLPISGATLRKSPPGQCVVITDHELMNVVQNLWLDNIYIRHQLSSRSDTETVLWCGKDCNLWLTAVTIQDDGDTSPSHGAFTVIGGQVYTEDLLIADFSSQVSAVWLSGGSTMVNKRCTIVGNKVTGDKKNNAVISVNGVDPDKEDSQQQDTVAVFQGCTIADNVGETISAQKDSSLFTAFEPLVFSDSPIDYFTGTTPAYEQSDPLSDVPRTGITSNSAWFTSLQSEVPKASIPAPPPTPAPMPPPTPAPIPPPAPAPVTPPPVSDASRTPVTSPTPGSGIPAGTSDSQANIGDTRRQDRTFPPNPDTGEDDTNGGVSRIAIIAGVAATAFVVIGAVVLVLLIRRRKEKRNKADKGAVAALPYAGQPEVPPGVPQAVEPWAPPPGSLPSGAPQKAYSVPAPDPYHMGMHPGMPPPDVPQRAHSIPAPVPTYLKGAPPGQQPAGAQGLQHQEAAKLLTVTDTGSTVTSHNASSFNFQNVGKGSSPHDRVAPRVQDTMDMTNSVLPMLQAPTATSTTYDILEFIHQQIDSLGTEKPVLNGLVLLTHGDHVRLQGGQAVIQMARSVRDGLEYAIKFFASQEGFEVERDMYAGRNMPVGLTQFLPEVREMEPNANKSIVDGHGHPLPPYIVMERGESLDIWAARAKPDHTQAYSMLFQLAGRLKDLHALGYVHRDLKPANVMWLPRQNRWTVIDFGCAARTGEEARLAFSLAYAAPEVISAYRRGDKTTVPQEALDVWSLGVMGFELLTGKSVMSGLQGQENAMDSIEGCNGKSLPWEGDNLSVANRRRLGVLKSSLLALLARDPAKRLSMEDFCDTCNRLLLGNTSIQV